MPQEIADLLSVPAVADKTGLHEQTIRKLIRTGELVATRIGTRVFVHPDDYADFIDRHRTGNGR